MRGRDARVDNAGEDPVASVQRRIGNAAAGLGERHRRIDFLRSAAPPCRQVLLGYRDCRAMICTVDVPTPGSRFIHGHR